MAPSGRWNAAPVPLAAAMLVACATAVVDDSRSCPAAGDHAARPGCHSTRADVPSSANVQLQSTTKVLRELSAEGATSEAGIPALSLASISARRVSQTARLRSAATQVRAAAERMHSTWENSVYEIDSLLSGFGNQMAASEDSCSTQLLRYKHSLSQIHTDITTVAVEVNNTEASVAVYAEECREKNTELMQLETATHTKETKCVTETSVERKTLEVLKVDLREMQHIAKSHVTLSSSMSNGYASASAPSIGSGESNYYDGRGGSGSYSGAGGSNSYGGVRGSGYGTGSTAAYGGSISSSTSSSVSRVSGPIGSASYGRVGGTSSANSYGELANGGAGSGMSYSNGVVGSSPLGGVWNMGTSGSRGYSLIEAQGSAEAVQPTMDNLDPPSQERVASVQSMVQQTKTVAAKVATCMDGAGSSGGSSVAPIDASLIGMREEANLTASAAGRPYRSPPMPDACGEDQIRPRCYPITCTELGWVCGEPPRCSGPAPRCHPLSCVDGSWQCGAVTDPAYEVCQGKSFGEACTFSKGMGYCKSDLYGQSSKCSIPEVPTACKEVVIELEHSFTVSYISLTRLIEEYEAVTHSTVCEETVRQEYTKLSSTLQQEADVACSHVQKEISNLQKFKMQYQTSVQTQTQLEKSIEVLVNQCGSLSETESDLENVKTTIKALGNCPGLGEVGFQIPTWTGEWVQWKQERWQTDAANDAAMLAACQSKFGGGNGVRPAEVSEIDSQTIQNMPAKNTAPVPVVGACPLCRGDDNGGLSQEGHGRICWDAGVVLSRDTRRGDCAGGLRSALCVYDHGVLPRPQPPRPYAPQPFPQPSGHWAPR